MKFDDICSRIEKIRNLKERKIIMEEALGNLEKHGIGLQTLRIGYDSEAGYLNDSVNFDVKETVEMLEFLIDKTSTEISNAKKELQGIKIEID